ncbi:MAG TPA: hypothetical protein VLI94_05495 [Solirubrobacterales bacterium]|nr:hypothetical protein [Solirubrobacterales bacterium]
MSSSGDPAKQEPSWKQRITNAEINGRRVNEAIERGEGNSRPAVFVCECGHLGCSSTLELEIAEYEGVRTNFDRFLVLPGHEIEAVDRVVERHPEYLVVIKPDEEARKSAREADERTP